jgi:hypothetical protein
MSYTLQEGGLSETMMNIKRMSGNGHDSPSTATCPQDDDVTLVHFKVDIHENRIAFWPETGEILHSNQRSHGFESVATRVMGRNRKS